MTRGTVIVQDKDCEDGMSSLQTPTGSLAFPRHLSNGPAPPFPGNRKIELLL